MQFGLTHQLSCPAAGVIVADGATCRGQFDSLPNRLGFLGCP
jgi:hypothetical protein